MSRYSSWLWRGSWLAVVALLTAVTLSVFAQPGEDQGWSTPVNISQSGGAELPLLAVDADGRIHALWQDALAGFRYAASGDGRTWDPAQTVALPFSDPPFSAPADSDFAGLFAPELVADENGGLHGFWIDANGALAYSRALLSDVTNLDGWSAPQVLAESAAAVKVAAADGRLHLIYIRRFDTAALPAGVYSRNSTDGGASWSEAALLYASPYFRTMTPDQASLALAVSGNTVIAAWDNRSLDTVFVARSGSGGQLWNEPVIVDQRQAADLPGAPGPSQIEALAAGDMVHLIWQAQHEEACTQWHQFSSDNGRTWSAPQPAFTDARDCPASAQLLLSRSGLPFLLTAIRSEVYLQAWDGEQWSDPALQTPLNRFTDPITFRPVSFDCRQPVITADDRLLVVGCGAGNDSDIWAVSRPLGELADWSDRFQPTPAWSAPAAVAVSSFDLLSPRIVAGPDGRSHAIWSQSEDSFDVGQIVPDRRQTGVEIYYTRLEAERWAAPRPVLTSPSGEADDPAITAGLGGTLVVVWSGGEAGGIYASRVVADQASSVGEWETPVLLKDSSGGIGPDVVTGPDGTIYVAYARPFNEGRGIYLNWSLDGSVSWQNQPMLVFDGEAAQWTAVGRPQLALTGGNNLHLTWTQNGLPPDETGQSLVYAHSADGGETWTEPVAIAVGRILRHDLAGLGDRSLQLVWQAQEDDKTILWQQHSLDNGVSWSDPARLSDPGLAAGPVALIGDVAQEPHLVQLAADSNGRLLLQEWSWDGGRWLEEAQTDLGRGWQSANAITAVTDADGRFGVVYAALLADRTTDILSDSLFYTERALPETAVTPTPLPTLTPTPLPLAAATPTIMPSPTPAVALPEVTVESGIQVGLNSQAGRILFGVIPAALVLAVLVAIGARLTRRE